MRGGDTAAPCMVRPVALSVTLAAMASMAAVETTAAGTPSTQRRLTGCWSQTSPYSAREIPADRNEWGSRTWCFRPHGVLETWHTACDRGGGCDGWDGQFRYTVRRDRLELHDYAYDEKGNQRPLKRDCLPVFEAGERFVLTDCEMSRDPFVRADDPNRTH
jgi:hypothetical protein